MCLPALYSITARCLCVVVRRCLSSGVCSLMMIQAGVRHYVQPKRQVSQNI